MSQHDHLDPLKRLAAALRATRNDPLPASSSSSSFSLRRHLIRSTSLQQPQTLHPLAHRARSCPSSPRMSHSKRSSVSFGALTVYAFDSAEAPATRSGSIVNLSCGTPTATAKGSIFVS
ncbi:uncharacterized protein SPPG_09236 [Spizellomyces punctatus DAOM BR117]|uniref:Uncharacterized protein n=1 Tax=Spizellomyces punctatus (strain DAOM BR117) TaxID=645134 RepID=A0A0L0HEZ8_SPIPD|nr:uncharacterized protein SPPG_09236 [Spizellomyces punctatus DAOM BR117]KNC99581.1 hypothetical protein SPPG_09236 [Spizellomyces punctatus DAOM BR117]|eukprot:XP_016607621.1 hypothetical protein SPPG_09236 [Spizellomyces punctatus DAOM BR117]